MSASTPPQESSAEKTRRRLRAYSTKNMVYSMVAVLVIVFAWWAIMDSPADVQRESVDVDNPSQYAASQSDWSVWVPQDLGEQWRSNYARFEPIAEQPTWQAGWVTPDQEFVGIAQATAASAGAASDSGVSPGWQEEVLEPGAQQTGEKSVAGPGGPSAWQVWESPDQQALILPPQGEQTAATIVFGTASMADMTTFIEALEPVG